MMHEEQGRSQARTGVSDHPPGAALPPDHPLPRALAAYFAAHLPQLGGAGAGKHDVEVEVIPFPQGYSNITYLVRVLGDGEATETVLRRPPAGHYAAGAHDMSREYRVLSRLHAIYARAPHAFHYCDDPAIIGAPFYLMERRPGVVLRAGDAGLSRIPPATATGLAHSIIDNLAAIHALDYAAVGLDELGRPQGYIERQIGGWTRRYAAAATDPQPGLDRALTWLADHQPAAGRAALIHNDYKHDNLLLDADNLTRIEAVLDWEMCTLGDPRMDLGTTLGYWVEPGDPPALVEMFGLTTLAGTPDREAVVARYAATDAGESGGELIGDADALFFFVYGLVKVGVILQQIYARYQRGESDDPRFGKLGAAVAGCSLMADQALSKRRISRLFA